MPELAADDDEAVRDMLLADARFAGTPGREPGAGGGAIEPVLVGRTAVVGVRMVGVMVRGVPGPEEPGVTDIGTPPTGDAGFVGDYATASMPISSITYLSEDTLLAPSSFWLRPPAADW